MKKLLITTLLAGLVFSTAVQADDTFYFGTQYHQQKVSADDFDGDSSIKLGTVSVAGGYQFTPNWAVELRHHFSAKDKQETDGNESYRLKVESQQTLFLKGSYPLTSEFSLYGLAGYGRTKLQLEVSEVADNVIYNDQADFAKTGVTVGFGGEYQFTPALSATLEYLKHPMLKLAGEDAVNLKLDSIAIGLNYRF